MKLSLGPVVLAAAMFAVGCAASDAESGAVESGVSGAAPIAPGKYVTDGKLLMIYGTCSTANFLGEAATGPIDGRGVMHATEGDLCGGYKLTSPRPGEITVKWDRDPTAHLDAESVSACRSQEGTYLMMEASSFLEPKPGTYAKPNSPATLVIPAGCDAPVTLVGGGAPIARTRSDAEHPTGYLATDEGNVCSGYTFEGLADGNVKVAWAPPANASISHDHGVSAACKSVEGTYKPR